MANSIFSQLLLPVSSHGQDGHATPVAAGLPRHFSWRGKELMGKACWYYLLSATGSARNQDSMRWTIEWAWSLLAAAGFLQRSFVLRCAQEFITGPTGLSDSTNGIKNPSLPRSTSLLNSSNALSRPPQATSPTVRNMLTAATSFRTTAQHQGFFGGPAARLASVCGIIICAPGVPDHIIQGEPFAG